MRVILLAAGLCAALIGGSALAQGVSSSRVSGGRYEIVQSELAARWTFRLDRICGNVDQLVSDPDGDSYWQEIPFASRPNCGNASKPRFLLFLSGLAAKFTFLIDTAIGTTWELREDPELGPFWQRLE